MWILAAGKHGVLAIALKACAALISSIAAA
jgi:hypothetical protein